MGRAPFILILAVWLQFLTQGLHTRSFLGDRRVFVLMSWLWVGFWMRAGYQKDQAKDWAWNPGSSWLPSHEKGEGLGNRVNDQLCLCDEIIMKITKVWSLGNSRLVNTPLTRKVMSSISRGTETPVLWLLPDLSCVSIHLAVHLYTLSHPLQDTAVKNKCFSEFQEPLSKVV